jgi:hypothetical protein
MQNVFEAEEEVKQYITDITTLYYYKERLSHT